MVVGNRKGDVGEITAVKWLWLNGYEVFRNLGSTGPIDIVAISPIDEITLIDVKTITRVKGKENYVLSGLGEGNLKERQKELGVQILYADIETGRCSWDLDTLRNELDLSLNLKNEIKERSDLLNSF